LILVCICALGKTVPESWGAEGKDRVEPPGWKDGKIEKTRLLSFSPVDCWL